MVFFCAVVKTRGPSSVLSLWGWQDSVGAGADMDGLRVSLLRFALEPSQPYSQRTCLQLYYMAVVVCKIDVAERRRTCVSRARGVSRLLLDSQAYLSFCSEVMSFTLWMPSQSYASPTGGAVVTNTR